MIAANKVKKWREKAGITQDEAARLIGVSRSTYQHVELGEHSNVTMSTMQKFMMQVGSLNLRDFTR